MGNKETKSEVPVYNRGSSLVSTESQIKPSKQHPLSQREYKLLQQCLKRIPVQHGRPITEKVLQRVARQVVIIEHDGDREVITKGDAARGIYIIVEGSVRVLLSDGVTELANLSEGDFFGELSVLFDIPCTATVTTSSRCKCLMLDVDAARKLFHGVRIEMTDWFVTQRYLPTSDDGDTTRVLRRLCLISLSQIPAFNGWSETALKHLILQLDPALVILYQKNSVILLPRDPPNTIYVVIRGRVMIKDKNDQELLSHTVRGEPSVFGEEELLLGVNNEVFVQTTACCEIIVVREEWIYNTLQAYPETCSFESVFKSWKATRAMYKSLFDKYPGLLQYQVVFHLLKNSSMFCYCNSKFIHHICTEGFPQEFKQNENVCIKEENEDNSVVLVLKGECMLQTPTTQYTVKEGEVFCNYCDWIDKTSSLISQTKCLVFKIDQGVIETALSLYSSCHIIYPDQPT